MTNLDEQLLDWRKVKTEKQLADKETNKDLKQMHLKNYWFGVRAYTSKYHEKFDFYNEPKYPEPP